MAIFQAKKVTLEKISVENKAYIQLTNLLYVPRNDSKDAQRIAIIVFGIEINTSCFAAHLPKDKLENKTRTIAKILRQKSVSFIDIQSLVGFFHFAHR